VRCLRSYRRVGKLAVRVAVVPLVAAVLGGCGGSDRPPPPEEPQTNVVQPGAPGEPSRKLSAEEVASVETTKHTKADVEFMQAMIHHHWQAVLMTKWVPRRSPGADIPLMAKRMEISQEAEIELMQDWLRDRGIKPNEPGDHSGHDHGTGEGMPPGMLTSRQMGRLWNTKGRAFDRLFLRFMTYHHQGALQMVQELQADGGGAEPELSAFTRHVEADQAIEIARMRDLMTELR
jgi:uncharacterized protein (DUF305 family)